MARFRAERGVGTVEPWLGRRDEITRPPREYALASVFLPSSLWEVEGVLFEGQAGAVYDR